MKNAILLIASLFFYAWGEPRNILLMLLSIGINYVFGRIIEADRASQSKMRVWNLGFAVLWNVLILGIFKYVSGISQTLHTMLPSLIPVVKIALPLAKPIIAVMVIFTMVAYWNDWFTALIYMQEKSRYPLQLVLRQILIQSQAMASMMGNMDGGYAEANKLTELIKFASIVVGSVPMLIAYPFVQKYFEKGFMAGAVKG
jgi:D-alanyl-lipoteichoic acid acyltransferase DltB (MBOAT superfamily)